MATGLYRWPSTNPPLKIEELIKANLMDPKAIEELSEYPLSTREATPGNQSISRPDVTGAMTRQRENY